MIKSLQPLAVLALLTVASAGCSQIPTADDVSIVGIETLTNRDASAAMAGGLAVAPVRVVIEETGTDGFIPNQVADRDSLQKEIVKWVQKTQLFQKCDPLYEEEDKEPSDLAWQIGADILLETDIKGLKPRFKDHHWSWVPNILNWAFWMVPAWYVAAENYELVLEAEFRIRLLDQKEPVYRTVIETVVEGRFDEFDRGWRLFGFAMLISPALNNGENWTRIAEQLFPAAASKLSQQLVQKLEDEFRTVTATKEFDRAKRRTLALVVGIGDYKDAKSFPAQPESLKGAKAVAQALSKRYGARYVRTLYGAQATMDRLEETIKAHLAARGRRGDNLLIFLSTRTLIKDGQPTIVMYDTTGDGQQSLDIARLAEILKPLPGNVGVMLEADYPGANKELALSKVYEPLINSGITIMSATKPGQPIVSTDFNMGLFAYYTAEALSGKGDLNRDGTMTYSELSRYVERRVRSDAGFRGAGQNPFIEIRSRS